MTNYKQLCVELLSELENAIRVIYAEDGTRHISSAYPVINKVKNTLAEPEPEEPTDEELLCIAAEAIDGYSNCGIKPGEYEEVTEQAVEAYGSELIAYARAVLARWGGTNPTTETP